jgi:hypothetical protein
MLSLTCLCGPFTQVPIRQEQRGQHLHNSQPARGDPDPVRVRHRYPDVGGLLKHDRPGKSLQIPTQHTHLHNPQRAGNDPDPVCARYRYPDVEVLLEQHRAGKSFCDIMKHMHAQNFSLREGTQTLHVYVTNTLMSKSCLNSTVLVGLSKIPVIESILCTCNITCM